MPKGRRFSPEQIITKLREAEILLSQGKSVEEAARVLEIASQTYYRWRKEYGDMTQRQARKLKDMKKKICSSRSWRRIECDWHFPPVYR